MMYNCRHREVQGREFWMGPEPAMAVRHKSALTLVAIVAALCMVALFILAPVLFNSENLGEGFVRRFAHVPLGSDFRGGN